MKGVEAKNTTECPTANRIIIYPADNRDEHEFHIICPFYEDDENIVEMFSNGWNIFSQYRKIQSRNARSFVIEFLQREPGNFVVTWMEVSKNPKLILPAASLLMIGGSPPECPHR